MLGAVLIGYPDIFAQHIVDSISTQESEADYIGMMLMAQACYDPSEAVEVFERFGAEEKKSGAKQPPFLRTYPSSHDRLEKVEQWLPEARLKQAISKCSSTLGYAHEFRQAFNRQH